MGHGRGRQDPYWFLSHDKGRTQCYLQHVVHVIDAQLTEKLRLLASMRNWSSDDSMQWPMNKRLLRDRADSLILRNIAVQCARRAPCET